MIVALMPSVDATDKKLKEILPKEYQASCFVVRLHFPDDRGEATMIMVWRTDNDDDLRNMRESADVLFQVAARMVATADHNTSIILLPNTPV